MGSQLISNVVSSFFLAMVLTALLTGSVAEAASYERWDGTIVDPILDNFSNPHAYSGPNLKLGAYLPYATLSYAYLPYATLSNADLNRANLAWTNLRDADLSYTNLSYTNLSYTNLSYTNLSYTNLSYTNLSYTNLSYTNLTDSTLTGANLSYADLSYADLSYADLSYADLSYADLYSADLYSADLYSADLYSADLYSADLYSADLYSADLYSANLYHAYLSGANLAEANLYGAILTNANLFGADLTGVDLYSANLTDAYNFEISYGSPYYYGNTTLPAGFDPVAKGWILAPYCDFTPDAACNLADINQMFDVGNLEAGVATTVSNDRLDLIDDDTLDAADISEWLSQAATANGHGSPYLRGDTEFDRDVDITDFNLLAANFAPSGYATSAIPEPSTMLLASLALILVGVSFRLSKNG